MLPITPLVDECKGNQRRCSLRVDAAFAIGGRFQPAATHQDSPGTGRLRNLSESSHVLRYAARVHRGSHRVVC